MRTFILGRLATLVLICLAASFLVFLSLHLAPGSPENFLVRGNSVTAETLRAVRAQYSLDDPFIVQYWNWLTNAVQGDFGRSLQFRQSVSGLIESRLPTTLFLVGYAALLIFVVGIGLGVLAAVKRGTVNSIVLVVTSIGTATPAFVAAIFLVTIFSVKLGWFPAFGNGSGFLDRVWHLTLPAIALAISSVALVARATRSAMESELNAEYVETARARGVPERAVIWRHAFRNALGPIATLAGLLVSSLLVITTLVETVFGLSGVGSLLVQAVNAKDFPVVQAGVLLIVGAFVVTNAIVDIAYPWIDPRVRGRKR
ncbi:ABC transporter permease [Conexibacter woesei]|uniref:Binding-protein-dependent transport systems inner membrane component n=1 Tax=Conexibacter woesei (strain DSM 14684 / CCUG 47730 / CIP 108061 / JCM 11494 / NBRC 100937 / ID131577) TaxID=469383 RepID=D3F1T0_CONWI|nr:ABC transporter permease [Conexibacter woesei]ADB54111.1 binding-protein-dependent transport systems inner membrane component [Conexibacter woesei DSM 14684]